METRDSNDKPLKITRRRFLGNAGALIGVSVALPASNLIGQSENPQPVTLPSRKLREGKEEIAKVKPEIKSLTYERARELIPSVANLFVSTINSRQSPQGIIDHVFIVRETKSWKEVLNIPDEGINELPAIQNLGRDYPGLVIDRELARNLAGMYPKIAFVSAPDKGRNIFINLLMFSDHNLPFAFKGIEYNQIAGEVRCKTIDSETAFRTVLLHEMTHRETDATLPLEPEIANAYKKLFGDKINVTEKRGLSLLGEEKGNLRRLPGFDELVAEYISAKISTRNGLNYSPAYARPIDLYNLELMLKKARITDQELLDMYRESRLRDFLLKIGFAAKEGLTETKAIELGLDLSFKMNANDRWPVPWNEVKPFFPEIDTKTYKYPDLDDVSPPIQGGCTI